MQDLDRDIARDKKLFRRIWQGPLLAFAIVLLLHLVGDVVLPPVQDPLAPRTFWYTARIVVFAVLGFGGMAGIFYLMFWSLELPRQWRIRSAEVLPLVQSETSLASETKMVQPTAPQRRWGKWTQILLACLLAFCVLLGGGGAVLSFFSPVFARILDAFIWLVLAVSFVLQLVVSKRQEKAGGENALSLKTYLLQTAGLALVPVFSLLPLWGIFSLDRWMNLHLDLSVMLFLGMLILDFFLAVYFFLPYRWVETGLRCADYEKTLRRARWIEPWHLLFSDYLNLRGYTLFLSGRYEEADRLLRSGMRASRSRFSLRESDVLDNLGCVLAAQGRYGEAIQLFEGSITISPQQVAAYDDLAHACLFQGDEPERALDLADRALANYHAAFWRRLTVRYQLGITQSIRAWALAQLGRHAEAAQALEQAFAVADRGYVPEFAGMLYRGGQVELLGGDRAKAGEHWRQARQLDPHGHFGGLADQALQMHSG